MVLHDPFLIYLMVIQYFYLFENYYTSHILVHTLYQIQIVLNFLEIPLYYKIIYFLSKLTYLINKIQIFL